MVSRALVEDCCGWNKKTWADAVEWAMRKAGSMRGKRVVEIGASASSALAPAFAAAGADVVCTFYGERAGRPGLRLGALAAKYGLGPIPLHEMPLGGLDDRWDVIVMKSVLGGIFRGDDYGVLRLAIDRLLADNLTPGGVIITIDNGYIGPFARLRRVLNSGGGASWTYFDAGKWAACLAGLDSACAGFGYFNVASAALQWAGPNAGLLDTFMGRNAELLNTFVYRIDNVATAMFKPREAAVLATVIREGVSHG